jgi:hypothetical protein
MPPVWNIGHRVKADPGLVVLSLSDKVGGLREDLRRWDSSYPFRPAVVGRRRRKGGRAAGDHRDKVTCGIEKNVVGLVEGLSGEHLTASGGRWPTTGFVSSERAR